jgi:predicted HTH domain antitoxin
MAEKSPDTSRRPPLRKPQRGSRAVTIQEEGYSDGEGHVIMMDMDTLTLEIPKEITQALRLPPQEQEGRLRLELAIALYCQGILGLGKAAELARLTPLRFDEELGRRHVPMHYGDLEMAQDVVYARGRQ